MISTGRWQVIPEFPIYIIDEYGQIFNTMTHEQMRTSQTNHGHGKISLMAPDKTRHTRSVAVLVAEAFVEPPTLLCDTVVILDGNLDNIVASNLVWRPKGFAWNYVRQLKTPQPLHFTNLRVTNVVDNVEYMSIVQAGMIEGLLFVDIWRSTYSGSRVFPYGAIFEITERV